MTASPAQRAALALVAQGGYFFRATTAQARHVRRPEVIQRPTLAALFREGLIDYDPMYRQLLRLTVKGRQVLAAQGYRVTKSFYADGPSMVEWIVTKEGTEIHESFPTRKEALAWIGEQA